MSSEIAYNNWAADMAVRNRNAISKAVGCQAVSTVKMLSLFLRPRLFREKGQPSDLEHVGTSD